MKLEINNNFGEIFIGPPIIQLTDKAIEDKYYGYKICKAIRSGKLCYYGNFA